MSSSCHNRYISVNVNNNDDKEIKETKNMDNESICTICYSQIEDDTKTTLKCGHIYHTECYTTYIAFNIVNKKETITCPVCRNNILEIVVNKPDVIHIITDDGENDIESQSLYDDNTFQFGYCMTTHCCGLFVLRLIMVGVIYCVLHFTLFCTYSDSC